MASTELPVSLRWWPLDRPDNGPGSWLVPLLPGETAGAAATGLSIQHLRTLVLLLLAYPLASLMRRLPTPRAKHAFSTVAGLLFLMFAYDRAAVYPVLTVAASYAILRAAPAVHAPWWIFAVTLVVLCFTHLRRMLVPEHFAWDVSGAQMVLTIKLTSIAFEVVDGVRLQRAGPLLQPPPPSAAKSHAVEARPNTAGVPLPGVMAGESKSDVSRHPRLAWKRERLERAITQTPSVLEYAGYAFFFGGILTGPAFDYHEYTTALSGSKYRRVAPGLRGQAPVHTTTGRHRPSAERAYFRLLSMALGFLGAHLALSSVVPPTTLLSETFYAGTALWLRWVWVFAAMLAERLKYYFIWLTAEGACMSAGFGWEYRHPIAATASSGNAADGEPVAHGLRDLEGTWSGVNNIDVRGFEGAHSLRAASVMWNKHTSTWLRRCVYERVPRSLQLVATYTVSAFWHGFYPGYYLFFFSAALGQTVNKMARDRLRPWFLPGGRWASYKRLYDVAGLMATAVFINYLAPAFVLRSVEDTMLVWSSLAFGGHGLLAVLALVLLLIRAPPRGGTTTTHEGQHGQVSDSPAERPKTN